MREREERARLERIEKAILEELKQRLYAVLAERGRAADVRDLDVRELEDLD